MQSNALIATGRNKDWPSMLWTYTLGEQLRQVSFSSDNETVAACSDDGSITLFDVKTGVPGMRLRGHDRAVASIAFSPDGNRLASGSVDRSVIIWDLQTGNIVGKPLTGHSSNVTSVVYSPDGRFIASRSYKGEIRIWDALSGAVIRVMEGCREWGRLAYSNDGARIACCGAEGIVIRDTQSGELLEELSDIGYIIVIAHSQGDKFLASGCENGITRVWDAKTFVVAAEHIEHANYVFSVAFSSDGESLISASNEGKMVCWNMTSGQMSGVAVQGSNILSAACSSDDHLYASGSADGSIRVWTISSLFNTDSSAVSSRLRRVACSPGGSEIASASSNGEIRIHSFSCGNLLRTLRGHTSEIKAVVYSPDGKLLASGSDDCNVRLWDAETGSELRIFEGHQRWVLSIVFLPDGKQILSSSSDATVRLWNIDDEASEGEILYIHTDTIRCLHTTRNGQLLAFGGVDGSILFMDIFTREMKELLIESDAAVSTLVFSPDDTYLASGSEDLIIRLWHVESQAVVRTFTGLTNSINSLSFS